MSDIINVIGHKSPDLDSVAAAIAYANFKNTLEKTDAYKARIAGQINKETEFALAKFDFERPPLLESAKDESLILVDHNETTQIVDGANEAKITEVIDHHKIDFKYAEPIWFTAKPWGSSSTIIAQMFLDNNIDISKNLAGLMLSAALVDTVIAKSPTCTPKDKEIIEILAKISGISNWQDYGLELFNVRSTVSEMSAQDVIKSDYKDFNFAAGKFGIGQVETVNLNEFAQKTDAIKFELEKIKDEGGYHSVILFITDIIKEGSQFLIATTDGDKIEEALGTKLENNEVYIPGIMSRKKQVVPMFTKVFDK